MLTKTTFGAGAIPAVKANYEKRKLNDNILITDKGEIFFKNIEKEPMKTLLKSTLDVGVGFAVEQFGGEAIGKIASGLFGKLGKGAIAKKLNVPFNWVKNNTPAFLKKMGFSGIIEEVAEERLEDVARTVFQLDEEEFNINNWNMDKFLDNVIPNKDEFLAELGVISILGGGGSTISYAKKSIFDKLKSRQNKNTNTNTNNTTNNNTNNTNIEQTESQQIDNTQQSIINEDNNIIEALSNMTETEATKMLTELEKIETEQEKKAYENWIEKTRLELSKTKLTEQEINDSLEMIDKFLSYGATSNYLKTPTSRINFLKKSKLNIETKSNIYSSKEQLLQDINNNLLPEFLETYNKEELSKNQLTKLIKNLNLKKSPSLVNFLRANGGVFDAGGNLKSQDINKLFPNLLRKKQTRTLKNKEGKEYTQDIGLDVQFQRAVEAGYFPEVQDYRDVDGVNMLLDAIIEEANGNPRFANIDDNLEYERLQEYISQLEQAGVDIEKIKRLKDFDYKKYILNQEDNYNIQEEFNILKNELEQREQNFEDKLEQMVSLKEEINKDLENKGLTINEGGVQIIEDGNNIENIKKYIIDNYGTKIKDIVGEINTNDFIEIYRGDRTVILYSAFKNKIESNLKTYELEDLSKRVKQLEKISNIKIKEKQPQEIETRKNIINEYKNKSLEEIIKKREELLKQKEKNGYHEGPNFPLNYYEVKDRKEIKRLYKEFYNKSLIKNEDIENFLIEIEKGKHNDFVKKYFPDYLERMDKYYKYEKDTKKIFNILEEINSIENTIDKKYLDSKDYIKKRIAEELPNSYIDGGLYSKYIYTPNGFILRLSDHEAFNSRSSSNYEINTANIDKVLNEIKNKKIELQKYEREFLKKEEDKLTEFQKENFTDIQKFKILSKSEAGRDIFYQIKQEERRPIDLNPDTIERIKESGMEDIINEDGTITLYHGGNEIGNYIDIKEADEIFYLTHNRELAEEYAEKNKGVVNEIKILPELVSFNTGTYEFELINNVYKNDDGVFVFNENSLYQNQNNQPLGQYNQKKHLITLFENANFSTVMHEMAHFWRQTVRDFAESGSQQAIQDLNVINEYVGANSSNWDRDQEERFARSFEAYLTEGVSPNEDMKSIFERIKDYMIEIYETITKLKVRLTPEIKNYFDSIFNNDANYSEEYKELKQQKKQAEITLQQEYGLSEEEAQKIANEKYQERIDKIEDELTNRGKQSNEYDYKKYRNIIKQAEDNKTNETLKSTKKTIKEFARNILLPVDNIVKDIDENTYYRLQKFFAELSITTHDNKLKIESFENKLKQIYKNNIDDYYDLDIALKNRYVDKIQEILNKYNLYNDYIKVRELLDNLREQALNVGIDTGYIMNYYPREIKVDMKDEFLDEIRTKNGEIYNDLMYNIEVLKEENLINSAEQELKFINNFMRGFITRNLILLTPNRNLKKPRMLENISPEYAKYFENSMVALKHYVENTTKDIIQRKFFGQEDLDTREKRNKINRLHKRLSTLIETSPGRIKTNEMYKLEIKKKTSELNLKRFMSLLQAEEIEKAINFNNPAYNSKIEDYEITIQSIKETIADIEGKIIENEKTNAYALKQIRINEVREEIENLEKEIGISDVLENSIANYINKIENLTTEQSKLLKRVLQAVLNPAMSGKWTKFVNNSGSILALNSISNAINQLPELANSFFKNGFLATSESLLNSKKIDLNDLGIGDILEEIEENKSGFIKKMMKFTGFDFIDSLGKNTFINASLLNIQENLKNNNKLINKEIDIIFKEKAEDVKDNILNNKITKEVREYLFIKLAEIQPLTMGSKTLSYLENGSTRWMYALKGYVIKQLGVLHNDIWNNIRKQNYNKAFKNLIKLQAFLILMGASKELIMSALTGFDDEEEKNIVNDVVIDNLIIFNILNRYTLANAGRKGVGSAIGDIISGAPIFSFADDLQKDLIKLSRGDLNIDNIRSVKYIPFGKDIKKIKKKNDK